MWEESYNMFSAGILTPKRLGHYKDFITCCMIPSNVFKLEKKEEASPSCWFPRIRIIGGDARQPKARRNSLLRFFNVPSDFKLT
jgi:hypothetical protein